MAGCCRNRAAANRHESIFLTSKRGRCPSRQPPIPHLWISRRDEFVGAMLAVCRISPSDQGAKCQRSARGLILGASNLRRVAAATLSARCTWAGWVPGESERLASTACLDLSMSQLSGSSTSSGNGRNGEERLRQTLRCPESQTASPCRIGKCNRLLGSIASEVHLQSSSASTMQE